MVGTAADFMAEALQQAGVNRVYGVVGDSLNGFTDALRRLDTHPVDPHASRGGGGLRRRRRGAADRRARGLRRQLRAGQPASDQRPVRLPSQPRPGAGDRRAHPEQRDRHRLFPGDPSGEPVPRMQPLCRAGLAARAAAADPDARDAHGDRAARRRRRRASRATWRWSRWRRRCRPGWRRRSRWCGRPSRSSTAWRHSWARPRGSRCCAAPAVPGRMRRWWRWRSG